MTEFKDTYSAQEVADLFKVKLRTVRGWIAGQHNHKMNATKVGRSFVISHEEVVRYANLMYGSTK